MDREIESRESFLERVKREDQTGEWIKRWDHFQKLCDRLAERIKIK